jgi:hypothetical protein
MKNNIWLDAMTVGVTDGNWYTLDRQGGNRLWLSCWADDGSMDSHELNALSYAEQGDLGGFCDVSDSAFDSYDDQWNFAKEIAPLFDANPLTIIRAIRG